MTDNYTLEELNQILATKPSISKIDSYNHNYTGNNNFKNEPNISNMTFSDAFISNQSLSTKSFHKYGSTWKRNKTSIDNNYHQFNWTCIRISNTGQYQTALVYNGYIYVSSDYGNSWNVKTKTVDSDSLKKNWISIDMVGDGSKQMSSDGNNIYTSEDYGNTWNLYIPDSLTSDEIPGGNLCISNDGKYITIATNNSTGKIYCFYSPSSQWNSQSWTSISTTDGFNFVDVKMSPNGEQQNILSNEGSLYYSGNYGVSFTPKDLINGIYTKFAMSSDNRYQSVISIDGLLHFSNDFGKSWNIQITPNIITNIIDVKISRTGKYHYLIINDGFLYISNDFGVSWLKNESNVFNGGSHFKSIAISTPEEFIVIVSDDGKILTSNDNGSSWCNNTEIYTSEIDFNDLSLLMSSDIAISEDFQYQTIAVFKYCIFTSNDSGSTWKQNVTLGSTSINQWESVCMSSDGRYQTACGGSVVATSNDFGKTWVTPNIDNHRNSSLAPFFQILSMDGFKFKSVRMSSNGLNQIVISEDGFIYSSSDYGVTWNKITTLIHQTNFKQTNVAISDDFSKIYISGYVDIGFGNTIYIYTSLDSGLTWNEDSITTTSNTSEKTTYLSVSGNGDNILITTSLQIFAKLTNVTELNNFGRLNSLTSLNTFSLESLPLTNIQVFRTAVISNDGDSIVVTVGSKTNIGGGYIYILDLTSSNPSWTPQIIPSDGISNINWSICLFSKSDVNKMVASTIDGKIYETVDRLNWTTNSSFSIINLENSSIDKIAISSDGKYQTITMIQYLNKNAGFILNSNDYGYTFTKNNNILDNHFFNVAISACGKYQIVCSYGKIDDSPNLGNLFVSNDFGVNWNKVSVDNTSLISVAISSSGKFQTALSMDKSIYQSYDYGVTWNLLNLINDIFSESYMFKEILISSSGEHQTIISLYGYVYQSDNFGKNWYKNTALGVGIRFFGAMSANGDCQSIVGITGINDVDIKNIDFSLYSTLNISTTTTINKGLTWETPLSINFYGNNIYNVTMSSSGQYQSLISFGSLYNSNDYGRTFNKCQSPFQKESLVLSMCTSSDGSYQTAIDYKGNLYSCVNYENNSNNYEISDLITDNTFIQDNSYIGNDIYKVSTLGDQINITLPVISNLFPSSRRKIIIIDDTCNADINPINIRCSGDDLISSIASSDSNIYTINIKSGRVKLISDGLNKWLAF